MLIADENFEAEHLVRHDDLSHEEGEELVENLMGNFFPEGASVPEKALFGLQNAAVNGGKTFVLIDLLHSCSATVVV